MGKRVYRWRGSPIARPVSNSETAAALVGTEKLDGIFLDLEMPRVHGFNLTNRIRESSWNRSTPIIVVSGRSDGETMQRSFSVGASYFLEKPVGRQKLSRLLRTVRNRAAVACAFRSIPK